MKKVFKILGITFFVFLILAIIITTYITGKSVFEGITNMVSREETVENIKFYKDEYENFANSHSLEEIKIKSTEFDHEIPAIVSKENKNNIAVLVHGMGGTKESMSQISEIFLNLDFDVLIIDERNSGENMADYSTFGILESYDVLDTVNFAKKNTKGKVLLFGESYGGAATLIAASRDDANMDYLVLDSPVANGYEFVDKVFTEIEEKEGIPKGFMKFAGSLYTKFKLGFTLDEINSTDYIKGKEINTPVLILNSKKDKMTPYHMGIEIYESINSDAKEIHTEKNYEHIEFAKKDSEGYKKVIGDFLEKY